MPTTPAASAAKATPRAVGQRRIVTTRMELSLKAYPISLSSAVRDVLGSEMIAHGNAICYNN
jgi:hypothetical protein